MKSYHGKERYYLRSRTSLNLAIPVGYVGTFCFIVFFPLKHDFIKDIPHFISHLFRHDIFIATSA